MSPQEEACLSIAIKAAVSVILVHRESVATANMAFSYGTDVSTDLGTLFPSTDQEQCSVCQ
jgi:hypothetical protein